jgi:hypothetical protein
MAMSKETQRKVQMHLAIAAKYAENGFNGLTHSSMDEFYLLVSNTHSNLVMAIIAAANEGIELPED